MYSTFISNTQSLPIALHHTPKNGVELAVYLTFISQVKVTLRLTASQSVSLGVKPHQLFISL
jgi:hypothetical protein